MNGERLAYHLYDDPWDFYHAMIHDIEHAREFIYIETYKYGRGSIGERFKNVLTQKAKKGVEVKLLIDSWGTSVSHSYFSEMIKYGGEVRFFMKIKFFLDFFTKNHRRNHRKIMVIDDRISYIGSANIVAHALNWREAVLRVEGPLSMEFKKVFVQDFDMYNKYVFKKPSYTRLLKHGDFEIIRDVPSITRQKVKKRYEQLIKQAVKSVYIETPYFLPGFLLRKAIADAAKRGIDVNIIFPKHSDIGIVDVIRNRYLGSLHNSGVKVWYYTPHNLHSKLMLVDDEIFFLGSTNFDYRSFRYQHEIMLQGMEPTVIDQCKKHIDSTIQDCEPFDYEEWRKRPFIYRVFELIFLPFRYLF